MCLVWENFVSQFIHFCIECKINMMQKEIALEKVLNVLKDDSLTTYELSKTIEEYGDLGQACFILL